MFNYSTVNILNFVLHKDIKDIKPRSEITQQLLIAFQQY